MRPPDTTDEEKELFKSKETVSNGKRNKKGINDLIFTFTVWCIFSIIWTWITPLPTLYRQQYPHETKEQLHPFVHEFIQKAVSEQVEPYKDGITQDTLSSMIKHGIRFRVFNNELFITQRLNTDGLPDGLIDLISVLIDFLNRNSIPNVEFVVALDPKLKCKSHKPYFAVARYGCPRFLLPDFDLLDPDWGITYRDLLTSSIPWEKRTDRSLYHVGQPSGGMQEKVKNRVSDDSLIYTDFTHPAQFCNYKYALHLEKGTGHNPFLKYALLCGSAVFWGNSGHYHHHGVWKEYFSLFLEDGHHVWGVHEKTPLACWKYALKYDVARKPAFSATISERSQRFAAHVLSPLAIDSYLVHLFREYSKLLKFPIEDGGIFNPALPLLSSNRETS